MDRVKPDAVVFRIDDGLVEEGRPTFVQVKVDKNSLAEDEGRMFTVRDGDTYLNMKRSQIFFVKLNEDETGSMEICSFTIDNAQGTEEREITSVLSTGEFPDLICELFYAYHTEVLPGFNIQ